MIKKINSNSPLLTIGLPVYNRENFIGKRLDNILSQTFHDFTILIYDNSNDSTPEICKDYVKRDSRIKHVHEDKSKIKHKGAAPSQVFAFNYVLQNADTDFFVWAASDDLWASDFLAKNVEILKKQSDVVGSIGQVKRYGPKIHEFKENTEDSFLVKKYKKFRRRFRPVEIFSIIGSSYEKRVTQFLKTQDELSMYAVFRTQPLQKSFVLTWSFVWKKNILNVLKYGKLIVTNETEWFWHTGASGVGNLFDEYKATDMYTLKTLLLPYSDYMRWFNENMGSKFVIKSMGFFTFLTIAHYIILIRSILKRN
jgi:glycosyltransferase involved in cell wall biosynthesis